MGELDEQGWTPLSEQRLRTQLRETQEELAKAKGLPTDGEICQSCGSAVALIWAAKDEDWRGIVGGPGGILCPKCFTDKAARRGEAFAFLAIPFTQGWNTDWYEARTERNRAIEERQEAYRWALANVRVAERRAEKAEAKARHIVNDWRRYQWTGGELNEHACPCCGAPWDSNGIRCLGEDCPLHFFPAELLAQQGGDDRGLPAYGWPYENPRGGE